MAYAKISGFSDEIDSQISVQFEVLDKLNIRYFEPRGVNGKNISQLTDEEAINLKKEMDAHGIKASSIGSPIGKIKVSDDFKPHFELFKRVVKIAKILDCKYIRMFSFYHDGGEWTESERDEVFRRIKEMLDYAIEEDVILLHENEADIYGDTDERSLDLLQEFACDNFAAVFDPANFVQSGVDTIKAYDMLKGYIKYMHIKDAYVSNKRVVPAGMGDGNVEYILDSLFKGGYDGFLSLEPHLGSFEGLADLELTDRMLSLPKSGEGTFTIAYNALNDILDKIK